MGILNFTPDSFSDGGKFNTIKNALKRLDEMQKQGADIVDIGGESTGPGSKNVAEEEELKRVIPILKQLRKHTHLPISIDTYKSRTALHSLQEGANIVNDVSALRADKNMAKIIARYKCPIILMYSKDKTPRTTIKNKKYNNVMGTIKSFLNERIQYAKSQGIKSHQIIIDPGMGQFISNIPKYSFEIIANLNALKELNHPILIGLSRKSFLGGKINERDEKAQPLSAIAYLNGASIIRTHDVKGTKKIINHLCQ